MELRVGVWEAGAVLLAVRDAGTWEAEGDRAGDFDADTEAVCEAGAEGALWLGVVDGETETVLDEDLEAAAETAAASAVTANRATQRTAATASRRAMVAGRGGGRR